MLFSFLSSVPSSPTFSTKSRQSCPQQIDANFGRAIHSFAKYQIFQKKEKNKTIKTRQMGMEGSERHNSDRLFNVCMCNWALDTYENASTPRLIKCNCSLFLVEKLSIFRGDRTCLIKLQQVAIDSGRRQRNYHNLTSPAFCSKTHCLLE